MSDLLAAPFFAIESLWSDIVPFVERCFEKADEHRFSPADVKQMLIERDLQLWLVVEDKQIKMVVMTQIVNYPQSRDMDLWFLCGEFVDGWRAHLDFLIQWAAEQGCHFVSTTTRPGMAKELGWGSRRMYTKRAI